MKTQPERIQNRISVYWFCAGFVGHIRLVNIPAKYPGWARPLQVHLPLACAARMRNIGCYIMLEYSAILVRNTVLE